MEIEVGRLRYVTARFPQLQGLRLVPLSFVFLASAAWRAGLVSLPGDIHPLIAQLWFFGAVVAAVCASFVARSWYSRHLGAVGQYYTRSAAIPLVVTSVIAGVALWVQVSEHWRLSLPPLAVGMALLGVGAADYEFRRHYLAAAGVLFGYSVLPILGLSWNALNVAFDAAVGLAILIAAVGDHLLVVRTLHPPEEVLP